jgi:lipopolysaccharide transport system ATP-binding protein
MSDTAIHVEHLSKRYRIGVVQQQHDTLRDQLVKSVKGLFRHNGQPHAGHEHFWALKDISFDVKQGEVMGIIGRNGAGKSTLLKILSRITEPTRGHAAVYGRVASLLEVGTGFHPELTGRENVYLNGAVLGMKRAEIERKFDEIVAFSGVEKFIDTPLKRYSSGMQVRLAFAVAAHLEPEILLVDEVLAVGDADFQDKCLGKMNQVARSGRTVLFVSHNMGAIARLCSRVLLIERGRLKLDGAARVVVESYLWSEADLSSTWINSSSDSNKSVQFTSARILSADETPVGIVRFDESFRLEIAYEVVHRTRNISILFRLTNAEGMAIWTSWDTDPDNWNSGSISEPGHYMSVCTVPGNLLKPGRYFVSLGGFVCGDHERSSYPEEEETVLIFDVSEMGYLYYPYCRDGTIAPLLKWQVTKLEPTYVHTDDQSQGSGATQ